MMNELSTGPSTTSSLITPRCRQGNSRSPHRSSAEGVGVLRPGSGTAERHPGALRTAAPHPQASNTRHFIRLITPGARQVLSVDKSVRETDISRDSRSEHSRGPGWHRTLTYTGRNRKPNQGVHIVFDGRWIRVPRTMRERGLFAPPSGIRHQHRVATVTRTDGEPVRRRSGACREKPPSSA